MNTVLVTGAAGGIGQACVRRFIANGDLVLALDKADLPSRQANASAGPTEDNACRYVVCDLSDAAETTRVVQRLLGEHDGLRCIVNAAALFTGARPIDSIGIAELRALFAVNFDSYFLVSRLALPTLRRNSGCIVNITSIVAEIGQWRDAAYTASKGAVTAFTKALAIEEAENGVRVNAVAPGIISTPALQSSVSRSAAPEAYATFLSSMQWADRIGTPEEVAAACFFLASEQASFITGAVLHVTGGLELGLGPKQPVPDFGSHT